MYVPSMIFGHLLTSSNYDDKQKKVTGGRNGYGAKLCNIFSTHFTVETACSTSKKAFKQVTVLVDSTDAQHRPSVCVFAALLYGSLTTAIAQHCKLVQLTASLALQGRDPLSSCERV